VYFQCNNISNFAEHRAVSLRQGRFLSVFFTCSRLWRRDERKRPSAPIPSNIYQSITILVISNSNPIPIYSWN